MMSFLRRIRFTNHYGCSRRLCTLILALGVLWVFGLPVQQASAGTFGVSVAQRPAQAGIGDASGLTRPTSGQNGETPQPGPELTLVVLGDSLSAGYNIGGDKAFPAVLEKALRERGHDVRVINAGVSGDTASGGLERLDWSVPDDASGVIVALGANDMLRGLDVSIPGKALDDIVQRLADKNIPVMLAGMRAAPNLGERYAEKFEAMYVDLAQRRQLLLYPFFLEGVAGDHSLMLDDGMHPNPEGVKVMVANILPTVEQFLDQIRSH